MKNFVQEGEVIDVTVSGSAVASGDVVLVGSLVGVAQISAAVGEVCSVALEGVYTVPKKSTDTFNQGDKLYWDNSAKNVTTTTSGNTFAGFAWIAGGNGDTTTQLRLQFS